jgi:hypothetical protein
MSALQRIDCLSRASYFFFVGSTEGCGNQQGLWRVRHAGRVVEKDLRWSMVSVDGLVVVEDRGRGQGV